MGPPPLHGSSRPTCLGSTRCKALHPAAWATSLVSSCELHKSLTDTGSMPPVTTAPSPNATAFNNRFPLAGRLLNPSTSVLAPRSQLIQQQSRTLQGPFGLNFRCCAYTWSCRLSNSSKCVVASRDTPGWEDRPLSALLRLFRVGRTTVELHAFNDLERQASALVATKERTIPLLNQMTQNAILHAAFEGE
jgi:hypothetical protein